MSLLRSASTSVLQARIEAASLPITVLRNPIKPSKIPFSQRQAPLPWSRSRVRLRGFRQSILARHSRDRSLTLLLANSDLSSASLSPRSSSSFRAFRLSSASVLSPARIFPCSLFPTEAQQRLSDTTTYGSPLPMMDATSLFHATPHTTDQTPTSGPKKISSSTKISKVTWLGDFPDAALIADEFSPDCVTSKVSPFIPNQSSTRTTKTVFGVYRSISISSSALLSASSRPSSLFSSPSSSSVDSLRSSRTFSTVSTPNSEPESLDHCLDSDAEALISLAKKEGILAPASTMPPTGICDTTISLKARRNLGTYGLTPTTTETYEIQSARCLRQLRSKSSPIEKYIYLSHLRNNNVHLFYRLCVDNMKELSYYVYTPTVGEACLKWSEIYEEPEGLYISYSDRGHIKDVLKNWKRDVDITVVTDGSRILGLGDLGINGMGIPIGKLALYVACAGINPQRTLPITVDLGTSNKKLREDYLYMGSRRDKVTADEEAEFLDELMEALVARWPGIVIQFEDWKNPFPSLERYAPKYPMFNDDIQGTGAVVLGGMITAVKASGTAPKDHRAVIMGAGSAAVGVAKQIVAYFMEQGLSEDEARKCFWLVDTKGMVTNDRGDKLAEHKTYFSRPDNNGVQCRNLGETVDYVKPTILLGLSTIGGIFDQQILTKMGQWNDRPIIFPLSNPLTASECDFETAMKCTQNRVLFASGSPFPSYEYEPGKLAIPGQGNNIYIFPAAGQGAILSKSTQITQGMIYASATSLSKTLNAREKAAGRLYPDISRIREVSILVTAGVIRAAQRDNVDRETFLRDLSDDELVDWITENMYDPHNASREIERAVEDGEMENRERNRARSLASGMSSIGLNKIGQKLEPKAHAVENGLPNGKTSHL